MNTLNNSIVNQIIDCVKYKLTYKDGKTDCFLIKVDKGKVYCEYILKGFKPVSASFLDFIKSFDSVQTDITTFNVNVTLSTREFFNKLGVIEKGQNAGSW